MPGQQGGQSPSLFLTVFQNIVTAINNLSQTFANVWPRVTGTFTLSSSPLTVTQPAIKATSVVVLSPTSATGASAGAYISAITPGSGFTVTGTAGAGATFSYAIFSPS